MRLAVTVGFDEALVIRAIANITADEIYLLRGITGTDGDERSKETVKRILKALQKGTEHVVDLRDPAVGLRQISEIHFDAVALSGGPRLLVILTFVVAVLRRSKIYVVPEYAPDAIDVTGLGSLIALGNLSAPKLRLISLLTEWKQADEVAKEAGLNSSTVYRHLDNLVELGLVFVDNRRKKRYIVDRLVAELASLVIRDKFNA